MNFNENLMQLLINRNLKQADLCRMTGIQTSLMSDYLRGKKSPTIGNAILIADAFNISLDTLVGKNINSDSKKDLNSKRLVELYEVAKELSDNEILFLLDTIKALKKCLNQKEN